MAHVSYSNTSSVLKRGPIANCSGCGRPYEQKEQTDVHCCDCKRLVRLGLEPRKAN